VAQVPRPLLDRLTDGPVPVAAVPDADVAALRDTGATVRRDGDVYRLLDCEYGGAAVAAALDPAYAVEWHSTVESTNRIGRRRGAAGHTDRVILAAEQTGGRGRRDRRWQSPAGGVWLSIVLEPTLQPDRRGLLTFAAAVAVVDAADAVGVPAQIKWPNDVVVTDADHPGKVAGVLTEVHTADAGVPYAVLGVGINAAVDPTSLPVDATSLAAIAGTVDWTTVATTVIETVDALRDDPDRILRRWRALARTPGHRVRVTTADGAVVGTAVDVTDTGALVVDDGTDEHVVAAGDCDHLRPA